MHRKIPNLAKRMLNYINKPKRPPRDFRFDTMEAFLEFLARADIGAQIEKEKRIIEHSKNAEVKMKFFCTVCHTKVSPALCFNHDSGVGVSFREQPVCPKCGQNTRLRFMFWAVKREFSSIKSETIYIQEQVTSFFDLLQNHFPDITGSEFLGNDVAPGQLINGIRNEDCHRLSFPDNSIGLYISNDIFEHIPDVKAAFAEAKRVLAPQGVLLFSTPFSPYTKKTIKRADYEGEQLVHYEPPRYHGNPLSGEGSLVFSDYGQDLFEILRECGFSQISILCSDDYKYGFYGRPVIFMAKK